MFPRERYDRDSFTPTGNCKTIWTYFERSRSADRVLSKFVQIVLQLPVGVKESRSYRSLGNIQDFTDFCVGHPLNMEHGYHSSVFIRQLHHRLVQPFLEF